MSRDLQCLDSTPINRPELWSLQQQPSDSRLNDALTYVAQEVEWATSAISFAVKGDINPVETIAIRAIEQNTSSSLPLSL